MDQFDRPALVPPTTVNLAAFPRRNAQERPDMTAASVQRDGTWVDVTFAEFDRDVRALAKGLMASGLQAGERVAILSKTRYEWSVLDFAAWSAGLVPVPIYETSSAHQVAWILADSGAAAVVVETAAHAEVVAEARHETPELRDVHVIDDGGLDQLRRAGEAVAEDELDRRMTHLQPDHVATIIYTSGTTGRPKGCELTHANFVDLAQNAAASLGDLVGEGRSTLLFLPMAHVFARAIAVICVVTRTRLGHTPDARRVMDDLGGFRPTFLLVVPRILEKIYNTAEQQAAARKRNKVFHWAARVAIRYSRDLDTEKGPDLSIRSAHRVADQLLYRTLRKKLGGRARYVISGGAPLGTRLGHFYRGIGLTVLEGYGLTETTAPVSVNTPDLSKIGTVGLPLPGTSVRVSEDGELLVKGIGVFGRYHDNDEATREAFEGDWFRTGDLAAIDEDGYLTITGRSKELLVTAAGKNVSPAVLEDRLRGHQLISQCMVVGDQRPFVGALLTLDAEMVPTWCRNRGLGDLGMEEAAQDETVRAELQKAVDYANRAVSRAESIRKWVVLNEDFTEQNGYLTPSLKLKRHEVMRDFGQVVDDLYGGPVKGPEDDA